MASDQTTGFRPWFAASPRQLARDKAFREAYETACAIQDRDGDLDMEPEGILDNIMAELRRLAGVQ